jgi:glyceraldehyde 3-phosphate dehydrogenase
MSKIRIAINGFGRIGRTLTRVIQQSEDIELVAVNDVHDAATMAHLLKYDSVHGKWKGVVEHTSNSLIIDGKIISYVQQKDPSLLPWKLLDIDIVIESTGLCKTKEQAQIHLSAGAKRVILSAPPEDDQIKTIVIGVNDHLISAEDIIVSNASCTTNSAAHLIQLIDEMCGIDGCYITTVHSYTGDQRLHDAPHKDWRRGRAATESIVPTSTGAAKALTRIFPHLIGKMGGCGIRVPVPDGSLTDITCTVRKPLSIEEINTAFKQASESRWKNIVEYTSDTIVSSDVVGNSHSCVFDAPLTSVIDDMVKVVGWYDNEFGYSSRLKDLILKIGTWS